MSRYPRVTAHAPWENGGVTGVLVDQERDASFVEVLVARGFVVEVWRVWEDRRELVEVLEV